MTPNDIEALANALQKQGIAMCEIHDDNQGVSIRLRLRAEAPVALPYSHSPTAAAATDNISNLLRSPGMGHFAACHPLMSNPAAASGQAVEAGQTVGYLLAGSRIGEIIASKAAVLGRLLVQEGELVGYGDAIFELS
jgi:biotin carboxyl carrier protein